MRLKTYTIKAKSNEFARVYFVSAHSVEEALLKLLKITKTPVDLDSVDVSQEYKIPSQIDG